MAPEGLYLYGGVGRGKTMLLDLFFESVHYAPKRRVHFQEFMADAHEAIDRARKAAADPIASAAAEIASGAALLCFDELEVPKSPTPGLIASAAAEPHALYVDGTGVESFARTASRLMEMRSEAHLAERHKHSSKANDPG